MHNEVIILKIKNKRIGKITLRNFFSCWRISSSLSHQGDRGILLVLMGWIRFYYLHEMKQPSYMISLSKNIRNKVSGKSSQGSKQ